MSRSKHRLPAYVNAWNKECREVRRRDHRKDRRRVKLLLEHDIEAPLPRRRGTQGWQTH